MENTPPWEQLRLNNASVRDIATTLENLLEPLDWP
jgi:hypothetical protein